MWNSVTSTGYKIHTIHPRPTLACYSDVICNVSDRENTIRLQLKKYDSVAVLTTRIGFYNPYVACLQCRTNAVCRNKNGLTYEIGEKLW